MIGDRTAEEIKVEIGSAMQPDNPATCLMEVRGRDQVTGLPKTIQMKSSEVTEAIAEPLRPSSGSRARCSSAPRPNWSATSSTAGW